MDLQTILASPRSFRDHLMVELADGSVGRYADRQAGFQTVCHEAADPMLRNIVAPGSVQPEWLRLWMERHRAGSKTTDAAVMAAYPFSASARPIYGVIIATDRDQDSIFRRQFEMLARCNPLIGDAWQIDKWSIKHKITGSQIDLIAADEASSWGLLCDLVICEEVSHWPNDRLWVSMLSTAAKRPHCGMIAIMNAGWQDSWAFGMREKVRQDPRWFFHSSAGEIAPWISPDALAEMQRLLPPHQYSRLLDNVWIPGGGDALPISDIRACATQDTVPMWPTSGAIRIAGLDLSIRRDRSAFTILEAVPGSGLVRLLYCQSWRPGPDGKVDLLQIEVDVESECRRWGVQEIFCDVYQAEAIIQRQNRYGTSGAVWRPISITAQITTELAKALLEAFRDRRVSLYEDRELINDLAALSIQERPNFGGFKITAARGADGHADRAFSFLLALPAALGIAMSPPVDPYEENRIEWVRA